MSRKREPVGYDEGAFSCPAIGSNCNLSVYKEFPSEVLANISANRFMKSSSKASVFGIKKNSGDSL